MVGIAPIATKFSSIRDMLIKQSKQYGDKIAVNWMDPTGRVATSMSFRHLEERSFNLARYMKNQGVEVGDNVVLLQETSGPNFLILFFACQILRATAVPVSAAAALNSPSTQSIIDEVEPALIIMKPETEALIRKTASRDPTNPEPIERLALCSRLGTRSINAFDGSLGGVPVAEENWEGTEGEGTTFIQYTSGTTVDPKGVVVSQTNIMNQLALISAYTNIQRDPELLRRSRSRYKFCGWMSPSFDYSFILSVLWTVYEGMESCLLPSAVATSSPLSWLGILSKYKIDIAAAPFYAFNKVARYYKKLSTEDKKANKWDFKELAQLHSFGGLLQPDYLKDFFGTFESYGLKESMFRNAYIAPEHVGVISMSSSAQTDRGYLSVGAVDQSASLKIVDPVTLEELPSGFEGEVWVTSGSKAQGYYEQSDDAVDVFNCKPKAQEAGLGYLRTGDLGVLVDGQLYIHSRLSEALTLGAKTYSAADIESCVEGYEGIARTLAFSYSPEHDPLRQYAVLMAELTDAASKQMRQPDMADHCAVLTRRVSAVKGIRISTVVLLTRGSLPETGTGKLRRTIAREQFVNGETSGSLYRWEAARLSLSEAMLPKSSSLPRNMSPKAVRRASILASPISAPSPPTPTIDLVRKQWKAVLGPTVSDDDDFFVFNGSLLLSLRLTHAVQKALRCPEVSIHHLADNPTLTAYAARVNELVDRRDSPERIAAKKAWLWEQVQLPTEFTSLVGRSTMPASRFAKPEKMFVTGVTEPLGAFITAELLSADETLIVYCLIEADSPQAGSQKITESLSRYALWRPQFSGRIMPVPGQLDVERFGMSQQGFTIIANDIKGIMHCGESADLFRSYAVEEGQNVRGTQEVIRLALSNSRGQPIPLCLMSTFAVFDPAHYPSTYYAQEAEVHFPPINSYTPGYSQTKWVAEQMVLRAAREYNLPASIYRVGAPLGHTAADGSLRLHPSLKVSLEGFAKIGSIPDALLQGRYPFATLDFAAKTIVASVDGSPMQGQVSFYHVANGKNYSPQRVIDALQVVSGRPLEVRGLSEWLGALDGFLPSDMLMDHKPSARKEVSLEFVAWASAFIPRTASHPFCLDVSTVQFEDRLRRLNMTRGFIVEGWTFEGLMESIYRDHSETIGRALAENLKWLVQEEERQAKTRKRWTLPGGSISATVLAKAIPKDSDPRPRAATQSDEKQLTPPNRNPNRAARTKSGAFMNLFLRTFSGDHGEAQE